MRLLACASAEATTTMVGGVQSAGRATVLASQVQALAIKVLRTVAVSTTTVVPGFKVDSAAQLTSVVPRDLGRDVVRLGAVVIAMAGAARAGRVHRGESFLLRCIEIHPTTRSGDLEACSSTTAK